MGNYDSKNNSGTLDSSNNYGVQVFGSSNKGFFPYMECWVKRDPPEKPRWNGFSWPPHPNQLVYWLVLVVFEIVYNGILVPSMSKNSQIAAYIILNIVFVAHLYAHVRVLLINPAHPILIRHWPKKQPTVNKALFKAELKKGRCIVCHLDMPKGSKHCGKCNKCVVEYDHHCTWLNTCIGRKNYTSFLACISTTVVWCGIIFIISLLLIIMYFANRPWLSPSRDDTFSTSNSTNASSSPVVAASAVNNTSDMQDADVVASPVKMSLRNQTLLKVNIMAKTASNPSLILFVPVKDEAWLAVMIIMAAASGFTFALVVHLLSLHIYLICTGDSAYHVSRTSSSSSVLSDGGLFAACLPPPRKTVRSKCRVSDMKNNCTKEDATRRLHVEVSVEETEDPRDSKGLTPSSTLCNEGFTLPSQSIA